MPDCGKASTSRSSGIQHTAARELLIGSAAARWRGGLHQATRYKPEGDKIMRMYAQTATIENGFVHLPMEAPWLADFLQEIVAFPNGNDQVDSSAQFLDWHKAPMVAYGAYEYMRREAEKARASGAIPTFQTAKQEYAIGSMGIVRIIWP